TELIVFVEGDLFFSEKTIEGWQEPLPYPYPINSEFWDADAMLSSDGNAMVFVSRRKEVLHMHHKKWETYHGDGFGNIDIFISLKDENGNWEEPINLGETINTPYAERTPFLHPDMKTLYFSSDGHGGLGKMDVYKTTRLDDTWMNWSTPVNLGKDINTTENDWGYKVSTDGKMAYFAISNENIGGEYSQDICTIELPKDLRPETVSTISGQLTDSEGYPIEAEIIWEDLQSGEIVGKLKSDPNTGKFFVVLPNDRQYSYFVSKDGFFPKANNIDLRDKGKQVDVDESLEMVRIEEMVEKDIALPLKNLFFETNKYNIKETSFLELDRLAQLIQDYNLKVEIAGHTDDRGSDQDNKVLSQNRANAVKKYLIKQGCDTNKIQAIGYGEDNPVKSNKTIEGRAKNRRVEVRFKR
ncbi:MAG: OmpA family protein, partial [Saprospiraceae bacterium]|nr:OmpA family protein [Saprospiraceae bacterium]